MIIEIKKAEELFAIIIKNDYSRDGISFVTPNEFSQQLAYMKHPSGKIIESHIHNRVSREVLYTQEVLVIKKGKLKIKFYDNKKVYFDSHLLESGDAILLATGGHGFEVVEDVEMYEIKQGPYLGDKDKTRF